MRNLAVVLICLFSFSSAIAKSTQTLPIKGSWKIVSYQIVGYPAMSEAKANNWIGKVAEFTTQKTATLRDASTRQVCPRFDYQVTTKNAEAYFLIGYQIKPHRLGITEEEIQLVSMTCQTNSWLGKYREFVLWTDEQMLSYWNGVIFFFAKQRYRSIRPTALTRPTTQSRSKTLLITPQSVGTLNPDSDFNKKTLTRALPGYRVKTKTTKDSDKAVESFELSRQGQRMLEVYPNPEATQKIGRIRIFDNRALAPAQAKLGTIYVDVFKNDEQLVDCQAGINDRSGQTLCSFENMSSIQYVFEPKSDGTKNISPIEALDQAKLVEFVWTADPSLITERVSTDRSVPQLSQ